MSSGKEMQKTEPKATRRDPERGEVPGRGSLLGRLVARRSPAQQHPAAWDSPEQTGRAFGKRDSGLESGRDNLRPDMSPVAAGQSVSSIPSQKGRGVKPPGGHHTREPHRSPLGPGRVLLLHSRGLGKPRRFPGCILPTESQRNPRPARAARTPAPPRRGCTSGPPFPCTLRSVNKADGKNI